MSSHKLIINNTLTVSVSKQLINMDDEDLKSRLFEMPKQRKRENWLCIKLIAPETVSNNKKYTAKDAVGAFCTECDRRIPFSVSNPSNVGRHMELKHADLISKHRES